MRISDRSGRLLLLTLVVICSAAQTSSANDGHVYRWYELEKLVHTEGWLTSDFWAPSGGLFSYPLTAAPPANVVLDPVAPGQWAVWLRVRDETAGMRVARATINGRQSYIMGGTNGGQWVWYEVAVVEGEEVDLTLSHVRTQVQMDPWFDALLLTDNLSFVPPGIPPDKDGYTTYQPAEDAEKGRRPAWVWWPEQPQPYTFAYFRKTFDLDEMPTRVAISVGCLGQYVLYLNGQDIGSGLEIGEILEYEVTHLCNQGTNVLAFEVEHAGFLPGLCVHLHARGPDGTESHVVSDLTWRANDTAVARWLDADLDDSSWHRPWARVGERELLGYWDHAPPE